MIGYMLLYVMYMYQFVHSVTLFYVWLHYCMLGGMYHSYRLGYKCCSLCLIICVYACVVGYTFIMHIHDCMWSSMQRCSGCCHV